MIIISASFVLLYGSLKAYAMLTHFLKRKRWLYLFVQAIFILPYKTVVYFNEMRIYIGLREKYIM